MIKVRTNLIKLCALVFSVCLAFAVFTLPNNKVSAEGTKTFEVVQEAKIREAEGDVAGGLRFTTNITGDYSGVKFGTLIFPAKNWDGNDLSGAVDANASNLKAVNVVAGNYDGTSTSFDASLIFDEDTILTYVKELGGDEGDLNTVMFNLYTMEFTAVAYADDGSSVKYSNSYTTSMRLTATEKYLAGNKTETVLGYLGNVDEKTVVANTVTAGEVVYVDDVVDYANTGSTKMYVNGDATDVNVGEGENINLPPNDVESVYLFEQDKTTILNVVTKNTVTKSGIDYSALENHIIDGDINDINKSNLVKVSYGGVEYDATSEETEPITGEKEALLYFETVNGEEKFVGFRGKKTATMSNTSNVAFTQDTTIGIDYLVKDYTSTKNKARTLSYTDTGFYVETDDTIYQITSINYWTRVINDAIELKEVLDKNYQSQPSNTFLYKDLGSCSVEGMAYRNTSTQQKGPFNHGYYKLGNDINMEDENGYVTWDFSSFKPATRSAHNGGFCGYFDGFGHSIVNYKSTSEYGLFSIVRSYGSSGGSNHIKGAIIKNFAIIEPVVDYTSALISYGIGHTSENQAQTFQDIYVEYGQINNNCLGLIYQPGTYARLKNVYVKYSGNSDGSYYNMIKGSELEANGYYHFDESVKSRISDDEYYFEELSDGGLLYGGGVLFTSTRYLTNQAAFSSVIVNSRSPVAHCIDSRYPINAYFRGKDGNTSLTTSNNNFKGGRITAATTFDHSFGYAFNEDTGIILVPKAIESTVAGDISTENKIDRDSQDGGYCDVCHKGTVKKITVGEPCTRTTDCTGTMQNHNGWNSNNAWTSPIMYVWAIHTSTDMGTAYGDTQGAVKFDGITKYKTTAAMKDAYSADSTIYDAFTTDYWYVDGGELVWRGAQA